MVSEHNTSFGFKDVQREEKAGLVRGVFDSVASDYDIMNDVMSAGVHRRWKAAMIDRLHPQPGDILIDCAGGTGDITAAFLRRADQRPNHQNKPPARALLSDINLEMLRAGTNRAYAHEFHGRIQRVCANGECLPFNDCTADRYSIAFGIRNITDISAALREAYRVLKPGGRFVCLEFSRPITATLERLYDAYSFNVIPWLGEKIAHDRDAYQYLIESIRRFPTQEQFAAMIEEAGFRQVRYENMSGGIAALHMGWRL